MGVLTDNDIVGFAQIARELVEKAGKSFLRGTSRAAGREAAARVVDLQHDGRETKLAADATLERKLVDALHATGISVLSEESGLRVRYNHPTLRWIVDPLDGSYNWRRGLLESMVSVALWDDREPVVGALFGLSTRRVAWGGPRIGAFVGSTPISVSDVSDARQATLCTGFPTRFPVGDRAAVDAFAGVLTRFGKVRMVGSAAASLLHVAAGRADAYAEHRIMPWDVAAGLAILQGAGGAFEMSFTDFSEPCSVVATNGRFPADVEILGALLD
ncbi:MAG: inositol monophosphatase family protein [Ilumatobacteraceae bacterium]|jgi:myo-inositol-1(or 4)-monophosphatase